MRPQRVPILMSYYALVNQGQALIYGQVAARRVRDLSFRSFSPRTTFRTLLSLYRSRPLANQTVRLHYDLFELEATTDKTGFFMIRHEVPAEDVPLERVSWKQQPVRLVEGLYDLGMHHVTTPEIVVSDIDDTIMHSHISRTLRKFRTLMFTPVERRRAIEPVKSLISYVVARGATAFYLSNSEQNLYPLIYRFLVLNAFPTGPLFLKQMRRLRDMIRYRKLPSPEVHKLKMLNILIPMFPEKNFVLVGDNTQFDLSIYLTASKKYPDNVRSIYIRRVKALPDEEKKIDEIKRMLAKSNVDFHYGTDFSHLITPKAVSHDR